MKKLDKLKKAMVEIKEFCSKTECIKCPFAYGSDNGVIVYCPLNPYDSRCAYPCNWDVDDWKEK